jgi:hypothetical protein
VIIDSRSGAQGVLPYLPLGEIAPPTRNSGESHNSSGGRQ